MSKTRSLALAIAVMALALTLVLLRFRAPPPLALAAPSELFSAARAKGELETLLGDGSPHPVGSEANARVRDRIVARLVALGLSPEVQRRFVCGDYGACTHLDNVIAVMDGGPDAVMLSVHYDSVGAGAGASDDGVSVAAALEVARALKDRAPLANTVVLAFLDGEEAGLLGAKAFVAHHPLSQRVRAVVNLDARGSSGPSLMFETAGATAQLSEIMDEHVSRPLTSSLFAAVYERLPNDTDFSVFKRAGMAGYNFAFIEDVAHYHTSLDDLAHVSDGSLQHHGDNSLALVRGLGGADLSHIADRGIGARAVWFDFLGVKLVHWREKQSLPLSLVAALLLLLAVTLRRPRDGSRGLWLAGMGLTTAALLVAWMASAALGFGIAALLAGDAERAMPAGSGHGWVLAGLWALAAAATLLVGAWLSRRVKPWVRYAGVWSLWAVIGVTVAALFPPACHLFVAPTLVAAGAALVMYKAEADSLASQLARLLPAFVAACMWLRVGLGLFHGVGLMAHPVITVVAGLAFAGVLPLAIPPWRGALPFAALSLACTAMVARAPAFDARSPQRMSIVHYQHAEREQSAAWWVDGSWGPIPEAVRAAGKLAPAGRAPLPWIGWGHIASGPAPRIAAATPVAEVIHDRPADDGGRRLRLRVQSLIGSSVVALLVPPNVSLRRASIRGVQLSPRSLSGSPDYNGYKLIACLSTPAAGEDFDLLVDTTSALAIEVIDVSRGLPSQGAELARARAPLGVPSQEGDLSIVATTLQVAASEPRSR